MSGLIEDCCEIKKTTTGINHPKIKASNIQVAGNHYKDFTIQPSEFIQKNGFDWCTGNAIKYLSRHKLKGGKEDLEKAKHYIDLLIEWEYW